MSAIFTEPNLFKLPMNLRTGDTQTLKMDLRSPDLPAPRLTTTSGIIEVSIFTGFKLYDITSRPKAEPRDLYQTTWSPKFRAGNQRFLSKRFWGCANEPPYFHHGRLTALREAVIAHSGEALKERKAYQTLLPDDQEALIEFLKSPLVLPPGTRDLIVDENFRRKTWPPERVVLSPVPSRKVHPQ
jgi:hypothetical protein